MASPRTYDQMLSNEWINEYVYFTLARKAVVQSLSSELSNSLRSYGLQHAMLPCLSPSPGVCSNSCPLSPWWHPTISSSVVPFSSCLQSFTSIRVFSSKSDLCIRWPKYWSFSFSINLSNEYSGFISFKVTGLISLQSKELSRVFSNTRIQSINSSALSLLYGPTLTYVPGYWKNHSFDYTELRRQSDVSAF